MSNFYRYCFLNVYHFMNMHFQMIIANFYLKGCVQHIILLYINAKTPYSISDGYSALSDHLIGLIKRYFNYFFVYCFIIDYKSFTVILLTHNILYIGPQFPYKFLLKYQIIRIKVLDWQCFYHIFVRNVLICQIAHLQIFIFMLG